jgi:hypothetical protein
MRKVIWVYENVKKSTEVYSRLNILSLIASVSIWNKFNPNTFKVLYCDEITNELIKNIGVEGIFNEILPIPENNGINTEIFWASSKLCVLEKVNEPIVLMDHDFFMFSNMEEHLGDSLLYSFEEVIKRNSYPSLNSKHIVNLPFKIPRYEKTACNVSFLYLPDYEFTNRYASLSLKMMESFSTLNEDEMNSGFLVLAEQWLLKQMIIDENVKSTSLIGNKYDIDSETYINEFTDSFIWGKNAINLKFKHIGTEKKKLFMDDYLSRYNREIDTLYRYIKSNKAIDIDLLKNNIKLIKNK